MPRNRDLRLRLFDLGPVAHADIRIRPLTLLTGQAPGKTITARALHAAASTADRFNADAVQTMPVVDVADHAIESPTAAGLAEAAYSALPAAAQNRISAWLDACLGDVTALRAANLAACFEVENLEALTRWGAHRQAPVVELLAVTAGIAADTAAAPDPHIVAEGDYMWPTRLLAAQPQPLAERLARSACQRYLTTAGIAGTSWYLPEGRAALTPLWRYLRDHGRISGGAGNAWDFTTGVLAACASADRETGSLWDTHDIPRRRIDPAATLEALHNACGGEAHIVSEPSWLHDIVFDTGDHQIPIHLASSTARDTAAVSLLAQHTLHHGDLLIIEEPAAAAPTNAARAVGRALVRLAAAGVTVVCTTNRAEILHEASNAVLRPPATSGSAEPGDHLAAADVSAWRFTHDPTAGGSVAEALAVDQVWGIRDVSATVVADPLHDETEQLIRRIA